MIVSLPTMYNCYSAKPVLEINLNVVISKDPSTEIKVPLTSIATKSFTYMIYFAAKSNVFALPSTFNSSNLTFSMMILVRLLKSMKQSSWNKIFWSLSSFILNSATGCIVTFLLKMQLEICKSNSNKLDDSDVNLISFPYILYEILYNWS